MTEELKNQEAQVTTEQVVADQVEAKPAEVTAEPTKEQKEQQERAESIAKVVAKVKAKEKELSTKERDLKNKEAELNGYRDMKEMIEKDPMAAIEKLGIDKNKLYEGILKSGEAPTVEDKVGKLEAEIEKLRQEREEEKKKAEEARHDAEIVNFKKKISDYVEQNKTELKVTHALGQTGAVYDVIQQNFNATGEVMSIEDAGKLVEDYFSKTGKEQYEKLKAIYEAEAPKEVVIDEDDNEVVPKKKTLTNKSTTIPDGQPTRLLSPEESKKYLIEKYKSKLFT